MATDASITWLLPGYPDEVALGTAAGQLWAAASTATLGSEEVWLGQVRGDCVANAARVLEDGACCRPAIAAFDHGGAVAVACAPGRIVAACAGASGEVSRWQLTVDGTPVHLAVAAIDARTWLTAEIARGATREVSVWAVDAATGAIEQHRTLGDGSTWCRWPVLARDGSALVIAWCEGAPRMPGAVRIARWDERLQPRTISVDPGEAPALAQLRDGAFAVAWHHGGASASSDDRDASVVRMIDVAIVRLGDDRVVATYPPSGAGGSFPRGEDQGWELAALAADRDGSLWLVGRSTHGHHVARRSAAGTWTAPMPLDEGGWGGRGRRHALVAHGDGMWLARRAPAGVILGVCPEPVPVMAGARPSRAIPTARSALRAGTTVLFGDLHQHTAHSDGCGSVEDLWIAARDQRGLDFAAVTDHDQFCRRALGPATWQLTTSVAAGFDEPGRFVAIAGYEFTGPRHPGPGHKCVYFADRVPERVPERDVDALFALLRDLGGIAVPHHVGWTGADFPHHDPSVQPVWEICSVHGCYEGDGAYPAHPPRADFIIPGHFVRDALAAGLRFGFIGSTDSHGLDWHHGIAHWRNPFRAGLACIIGAERTRADIIAALRARRSYATTGAKIIVRAEVDGAPMGSELPAATRGELLVEVSGTAPISKIIAVDNTTEHVLAVASGGTFARARMRLPEHARYLYVRIEQADGEAAWASPFWIGP